MESNQAKKSTIYFTVKEKKKMKSNLLPSHNHINQGMCDTLKKMVSTK